MGLRVDESIFLREYTARFGVLRTSARAGLLALLLFIASDPRISDVRWVAYILATIYHECAHGWEPIDEYGRGRGKPYGRVRKVITKFTRVERMVAYFGRGFVQLTWLDNYRKADAQLRAQYPDLVARFEAREGEQLDLVGYPEQALDAELAYAITSAGMRQGWFTGQTLARWLSPSSTNYLEARRIINGRDKADRIAGYAREFEACLRASALAPVPDAPTEASAAAHFAARAVRPVVSAASLTTGGAGAAVASGWTWVAIAIVAVGLVAVTGVAVWAVWRWIAADRRRRAAS